MPEKEDREITPHRGGFFEGFLLRIKLIIRLMGDSRVNPLLKLVPLASLVYFIMPDLAPGPVDDVAVIWIGLYLFVELCPPEVVAEHMQEVIFYHGGRDAATENFLANPPGRGAGRRQLRGADAVRRMVGRPQGG